MDTMDIVLWCLKGQMSGGSLESFAAWIQTGMCVAAWSQGPRLGGGWGMEAGKREKWVAVWTREEINIRPTLGTSTTS